MILSNKAKCAEYGSRGGSKRRDDVYCIEGVHVTMKQMTERLGLADSKATYCRFRRARMKGAVTWASLGLKE